MVPAEIYKGLQELILTVDLGLEGSKLTWLSVKFNKKNLFTQKPNNGPKYSVTFTWQDKELFFPELHVTSPTKDRLTKDYEYMIDLT